MIKVDATIEHPYVDSVTIENVSIVLESHANIRVLLKSSDDVELRSYSLVMSGDDYSNWNSSDLPYVKDWVLDQLGLTEAEEQVDDGYQDGYE